ncbi:MAG: DoxX-like family protein [Chloroflexi bacterium]|nr:DoxX-like family protein [Chloroflexota bacterium]
MAIFVETDLACGPDDLWQRAADPVQHERWDLRFTGIAYAAPPAAGDPQRFDYTTRLAFGIAIRGQGETIAERDRPDGSRVSALRFWSGDRLSLIREGRGYWLLSPTAEGVRFRTIYDYDTRFGALGRLIDRIAFRPLIGWATAWSFDRLRLWLERGIDPGTSARLALVHGLARVGIAAIFAWHGLVPKLLGPDVIERRMMADAGFATDAAVRALMGLGVAELVMAVALLLTWHRAGLALVALGFSVVATTLVAATSPAVLGAAFTPVTLNLGLGLLAAIDLLTLDGIPSAGRCRRRPWIAGAAEARS